MADKVEVTDLNEEELEFYLEQRFAKFKFTIATCAVYGFLAVVLLSVAILTSWGNRVLYQEMAAFVFTYILGIVIIIVYLSNEIHNFKPKKFDNRISYDAEMCPDYWKLENVSDAELSDSAGKKFTNSSVNANHFKYRCVFDDNLFNSSRFKDVDSSKAVDHRKNYEIDADDNLFVKIKDKSNLGINDEVHFEKFKELAANMNGYTYANNTLIKNNELAIGKGHQFDGNNIPMSCDTVYPLFLSVNDQMNSANNINEPSNKYRCAYAKKCGIAWTEAGCV